MTVLIIGFVTLSLLLATAVMAASAVYLEHKKLLSLADGAALAAADAYVAGEIGGGSSPSTTLADSRVLAAAGSYLDKSHAFVSHDHLTVQAETGRGPGDTAVVVLASIAHPPLISFLLPDGIAVEAKSTARSRLTQ
ncbi:pilus assembly protein TadG-related protein [Paenarthrobacter sp. RAF9]